MRARLELPKEPIAPAIDRIQEVLASFAAPGTFATRRTIGAEVLRIDVVDFGPLPLPLESSAARQLNEVASPAHYGLRDEHLASKPRTPGDWAITAALCCKCELCAHLGRFLRAANHQKLEWPLAKDRREHVHRTIDSYELPVTHVTRRTGSPHTLVLTKTRALFTREATERDAWTRDLAWLRKNARAFADAHSKSRRSIARPTAGWRSRV